MHSSWLKLKRKNLCKFHDQKRPVLVKTTGIRPVTPHLSACCCHFYFEQLQVIPYTPPSFKQCWEASEHTYFYIISIMNPLVWSRSHYWQLWALYIHGTVLYIGRTLVECHYTRKMQLAGTYWSAGWLRLHRCWLLLRRLRGWHRLGLNRGLRLWRDLSLCRSLPRGRALCLRRVRNGTRCRSWCLSRRWDGCWWLSGCCWLRRSHSSWRLVLNRWHPSSSGHGRCSLM